MEVRYLPGPVDARALDTEGLRENFLVPAAFTPNAITLTYTHADRMIIGTAVPTSAPLKLTEGAAFAAAFFHERRESGVINIGGAGTVHVDGTDYPIAKKEMVYIGRGSNEVQFSSTDPNAPALMYLISTPAHTEHPTVHVPQAAANAVHLGNQAGASTRVIYQYIHENGAQSCQLVMGYTELAAGNVWNTMPAHTHDRRSEVYMYFDIGGDDGVVFHFMGEPAHTRHLVMREGDSAISPSWSIHAGAGTAAYCFVWAMGGENQAFTDMDAIPLGALS